MTPGALLLFAAIASVAGIGTGPWFSRAWLACTLAGASAGLTAACSVLLLAADWEWRSALFLGGELVHLRLDGVSALFLALLCVVGGAGRCMRASTGRRIITRRPRRAVGPGGARCC
jgi:hydrogenase-4 component B